MSGQRGGFSIVELIVALVILTMGMLAMAAGSSYATIEVRGSALRSQRAAAVASIIEQVRAQGSTTAGFDGLTSLSSSTPQTVGRVKVWYDVAAESTPSLVNANGLKRITIWTQAPRYQAGGRWITPSAEGFVFDLYAPVKGQ